MSSHHTGRYAGGGGAGKGHQRRRCHSSLKDTPCGYCFQEWATCWDHIVPFSAGGRTIKGNLHPACSRCNGLASNLMFDSLDAKREYIRAKLIERGEWSFPNDQTEAA